jgi:hypothetical protein
VQDPLIINLSKYFRRVVFFDLIHSEENILDLSKWNYEEVMFTFTLLKILNKLGETTEDINLKSRIGVVTPYKGQVR